MGADGMDRCPPGPGVIREYDDSQSVIQRVEGVCEKTVF